MTYLIIYTQGGTWAVMANGYASEAQAEAARPAVWARMERDQAIDMVFPRVHRDYDGLMVTGAWRGGPGAYGALT